MDPTSAIGLAAEGLNIAAGAEGAGGGAGAECTRLPPNHCRLPPNGRRLPPNRLR